MTDMKCPVCGSYLHKIPVKEAWVCGTHDTKDELYGSKALWQELIRTRKTLEQSEICCTEWEKQALDYKAENIALSGDLERTRKALDAAIRRLDQMTWGCDSSDAEHLLKEIKEITTQEQKD